MIKVGINGFGRIGSLAFRAAMRRAILLRSSHMPSSMTPCIAVTTERSLLTTSAAC